LGISFLTACIGEAAYYANKNEPPTFEDKEEIYYQHAPSFHKRIRVLVSLITTIYGEEDDFARLLKIATLNKEDELLTDLFLQEVETALACNIRNMIIESIY